LLQQHRNSTTLNTFAKFAFRTTGAVMMAAARELFLVPNRIIDGGITGCPGPALLLFVRPVPVGLLLFLQLGFPSKLAGFLLKLWRGFLSKLADRHEACVTFQTFHRNPLPSGSPSRRPQPERTGFR